MQEVEAFMQFESFSPSGKGRQIFTRNIATCVLILYLVPLKQDMEPLQLIVHPSL